MKTLSRKSRSISLWGQLAVPLNLFLKETFAFCCIQPLLVICGYCFFSSASKNEIILFRIFSCFCQQPRSFQSTNPWLFRGFIFNCFSSAFMTIRNSSESTQISWPMINLLLIIFLNSFANAPEPATGFLLSKRRLTLWWDKVQLESKKNNLKTESRTSKHIASEKCILFRRLKAAHFLQKFEWGELFWFNFVELERIWKSWKTWNKSTMACLKSTTTAANVRTL